MRASSVSALTVVVASLLPAWPAAAQSPRQYCDITAANEAPTGDPLHPAHVYASFRPQIDRNEWGGIAAALEQDFAAAGTVGIPAEDREKFARQLRALAAELDAIERSPDVADIVARASGVNQVRFTITPNVIDGGYIVFPGTPDRIDIAEDAPAPVARELCYRAHAAARVLVRYGQSGRERTVNALGHYLSLWDNYNRQGYSQFPWELYVNGLWTARAATLTPPAGQWVVAHPAVAVEVTWPRTADLRRLDIITVEPIGYLRYRRDRRFYAGASLLVTLSATADPGYGALAHVGRLGKVGYVYHPREEEDSRHGAVFSVDLYKLIGGVPQQLQDARARVEALREEAVRAIK